MNYKVIGFTSSVDTPIIINPVTGLIYSTKADWKWMQSFSEKNNFAFNYNLPYAFGKSDRQLFCESVAYNPIGLWDVLLPEFLSESIKDDDISWQKPETNRERAFVAQFYNSDLSWEEALNKVKEAA